MRGMRGPGLQKNIFKDKEKPKEVRASNIIAAKGLKVVRSVNVVEFFCLVAVADAIRTSLGPRGMDKMIQSSNGDVTITNDGATILKQMSVLHPVARMVDNPLPKTHLNYPPALACGVIQGSGYRGW